MKPMTVQEAAQTLDAIRPLLESNALKVLQSYFDQRVEDLTEAAFHDAEIFTGDDIKIRVCVRNAVKKNWQPVKLALDLKRICESTLDNAKKQSDSAQTNPISQGI